MMEYVNTPLFGITLTIIVFSLCNFFYKKMDNPLLNPIAISIVLIIFFLKYMDISIENYQKGGNMISFFLGPATVALSIPIYKRIDLLKKNVMSILVAIFIGSLSGILSVILLSKLFLLDDIITLSLIPKSVTSAIAIDISKQINGIPSITVVFVIVTGILGNIISSRVFKLFKIKSKRAKGIALGTSSHVVGTTKAMELGSVEGAMSSLAIGIAGIITVFIAPVIINFIM